MKNIKMIMFAIAGVLLLTLCSEEPTEPIDITGETQFKDLEQKIVTIDGKTLTFYTAMTPMNHHICDSLVWDEITRDYQLPYDVYDPVTFTKHYELLCAPEEALEKAQEGCTDCCPCRRNPDTVYNVSSSGQYHNDWLAIAGIEAFEYNTLIITDEDNKVLRQFSDYDNISLIFDGQGIDTLENGSPHVFDFPNGIYGLTLKLYSSEAKTEADLIETIETKFAIIRTPVDNEGLVVYDEGDPLINE